MPSLFPPPCPQLPDFKSMLIRGDYHPSAPIHLLLSYAAAIPEAKAVFLTPRRDSLMNDLADLNDHQLNTSSGSGKCNGAAMRTQVFYPPTLAHLRLLLATLHEYNDTIHHKKTTLDAAPGLLVLHEVSAYLISQAVDATVSAYLSIVSSALALTARWAPGSLTTSKLAIFDSGLGSLKLPILRSLTFDGDDEGSTSTVRHRDSLSTLLERYLEWKVEFPEAFEEEGRALGSDRDDVVYEKKSLRICRTRAGRLGSEVPEDEAEALAVDTWTWVENHQIDDDGQDRTVFSWES